MLFLLRALVSPRSKIRSVSPSRRDSCKRLHGPLPVTSRGRKESLPRHWSVRTCPPRYGRRWCEGGLLTIRRKNGRRCSLSWSDLNRSITPCFMRCRRFSKERWNGMKTVSQSHSLVQLSRERMLSGPLASPMNLRCRRRRKTGSPWPSIGLLDTSSISISKRFVSCGPNGRKNRDTLTRYSKLSKLRLAEADPLRRLRESWLQRKPRCWLMSRRIGTRSMPCRYLRHRQLRDSQNRTGMDSWFGIRGIKPCCLV